MSPVDVIRFVCSIRRRLRLVDETSDPFLFKKSVDANQQLHTIESWYWKSSKIMAFDRPFSGLNAAVSYRLIGPQICLEFVAARIRLALRLDPEEC